MSKSIVSNEKICFVCDTPFNIHKHHVFEGTGRRKLSEKYGCWVYLCGYHHNMSNEGVHFNKELELRLKKQCQTTWESLFGSREEFIKLFGRNYL